MSEYITVSERTVDEALTEAQIILGAASDEIEYEIIEKGSAGFLGLGAKNAVIKARKRMSAEAEGHAPIAAVQATASSKDISEPKAKACVKPEKQAAAERPVGKPAKSKPFKKPEHSETKAPSPVEDRQGDSLEAAPAATLKAVDEDEVTALAIEFLSLIFKDLDMQVSITTGYNSKDRTLSIELAGDEMGLLIGKRGQTLDSLQYLTSLAVNKGKSYYVHIKLDTENYRHRRKATLENLAKNIAARVKRTKSSVALEPMNPYERRIIHYALQADKMVSTHSEGEEPYRKIIVSPKRR